MIKVYQTINYPRGILQFGFFLQGLKDKIISTGVEVANENQKVWNKCAKKVFTVDQQTDMIGGIHFWKSGREQ